MRLAHRYPPFLTEMKNYNFQSKFIDWTYSVSPQNDYL